MIAPLAFFTLFFLATTSLSSSHPAPHHHSSDHAPHHHSSDHSEEETLLCQMVDCKGTVAKLGGNVHSVGSFVPGSKLKYLIPSLVGDGDAKWDILFNLVE